MAIEVTCPRGHVLKVKDKYAGKTGCCPHCNSRVVVPMPAKVSEDEILEFVGPATTSPASAANQPDGDNDEESVYQHPIGSADSSSSSGLSLLGSQAVRHTKTCPECGSKVPLWHATCPKCDYFFTE